MATVTSVIRPALANLCCIAGVAVGLGAYGGLYLYKLEKEKRQVYAAVEQLERPKLDTMKRKYLAERDAARATNGGS